MMIYEICINTSMPFNVHTSSTTAVANISVHVHYTRGSEREKKNGEEFMNENLI